MVVVDNSEDSDILSQLRRGVATEVSVVAVPNKGYANAFNKGVEFLNEAGFDAQYTLVATHEIRMRLDALTVMQDTMDARDDVFVVGPTLIINDAKGDWIWSAGGYLSRLWNIPKHRLEGLPLRDLTESEPEEREWLDGACCLYRTEWLTSHPMREDYFLAFEETDYHLTIGRAGYRILWCPSAIVSQRASGTSAFILGRNMQKFQNRYGNRFQRWFMVPGLIVKNVGLALLRKKPLSYARELASGWLAAYGVVHDPYSNLPLAG
jgi:N-acetylglucosaminyl-diphospho-decaprenol L-rhamnosyltransferase